MPVILPRVSTPVGWLVGRASARPGDGRSFLAPGSALPLGLPAASAAVTVARLQRSRARGRSPVTVAGPRRTRTGFLPYPSTTKHAIRQGDPSKHPADIVLCMLMYVYAYTSASAASRRRAARTCGFACPAASYVCSGGHSRSYRSGFASRSPASHCRGRSHPGGGSDASR